MAAPQYQQLENPTPIFYKLPYEIRQMILKAALVCTPYSISLSPKGVSGLQSTYAGCDYQNYDGNQSDDDELVDIFASSESESDDSDGQSEDMDEEESNVRTNPRTLHTKDGEDELETVYKDYQFGPYPLKDIDEVGSRVEKRISRSAIYKLHESRIAEEGRRNKFWRCWCEYNETSTGYLFRFVEKPMIPVQLLRVNRTLYEEGVDILYGNNRFLLYDLSELQPRMISMFDAKSLQRIKNIGFTSSFPLGIDLRNRTFPEGGTLASSLPLGFLRGVDAPCWYNLRNLDKVDFFFSWFAALCKSAVSRHAYPRSLEYLCLSIECTARSIAAHLMQDFKDCREKLAAEGKALCCSDGSSIYNWDFYLESQISSPPTDRPPNDEMNVERRKYIRERVADFWEIAMRRRLRNLGTAEFEDRRSLTSQIAIQTERYIESPTLGAFEISVNPRFIRRKASEREPLDLPRREMQIVTGRRAPRVQLKQVSRA